MKNLYRISVAALVCLSLTVSLYAQDNRNTFFLDNNIYSYRINPAISGEKPFVGFIINNLDIDAKSNLGISSILYPRNGQLVTGLNSAVSAQEFLGKLKKYNGLSFGLDESILAFGFNSGEGKAFSTVELNLRTNFSSGIPKSLFEFLKVGSKNDAYDISGTKVNANAYIELAYGFSRNVNAVHGLRVGGRLKLLFGAANATASIPTAYLPANGSEVSMKGEASLEVAAPEVSFGHNEQGYLEISNIIFQKKFGLGGFGGAIDLGATYEPIPGLTVSASVTDLGGIGWKRNVYAKSSAEARFNGVVVTAGENSKIEDDLNETLKKLEEILKFKEVDGAGNSFEMIPCTINAGARYRMPFYDRLSAGILAGYKTNKYVGWFDIKGGLTVTPIDWFSLCGTLGYNSYCPTWGAAMSLNFINLNLFASIESYMGDVAEMKFDNIAAVVPVNSFRGQFNFGLSITFGQRKTNFIAGPHKKAEK